MIAVCDLCNAPQAPGAEEWTYTTLNEAASATDSMLTGKFWAEDPTWLVCAACKPLVDARDLAGLVSRSIRLQTAQQGLFTTQMGTAILNLHTQFLEHLVSEPPVQESVVLPEHVPGIRPAQKMDLHAPAFAPVCSCSWNPGGVYSEKEAVLAGQQHAAAKNAR